MCMWLDIGNVRFSIVHVKAWPNGAHLFSKRVNAFCDSCCKMVFWHSFLLVGRCCSHTSILSVLGSFMPPMESLTIMFSSVMQFLTPRFIRLMRSWPSVPMHAVVAKFRRKGCVFGLSLLQDMRPITSRTNLILCWKDWGSEQRTSLLVAFSPVHPAIILLLGVMVTSRYLLCAGQDTCYVLYTQRLGSVHDLFGRNVRSSDHGRS